MTTAAPLSLHSLLARLQATQGIAVLEHETADAPEAPWVSLEAGALELTVNLDLASSRVFIMTAQNQMLYSKVIGADWEQSVLNFLTVLAAAVEPEDAVA
ncbi:hypothetical protein [Pseudorhodoferax sp. Leaf265]|uniref:hypothetical protein n=1 Tax=Pseudorhodoferax sp. Leaf265 TaxID=1736315 RepID=UPI0007003942|nr:hypothetical protein [Pseudorhodoferax sp. Leaf265]KQP21336.1 hypothetical protein ASF45_03935 [Pseudorhodoferax sp. Leaf265]